MIKNSLAIGLSLAGMLSFIQGYAQRGLQPTDIYKLQNLSDMQLSPQGDWLAYSLSKADSSKDKYISHIWMTNFNGSESVQLTNGEDGDDSPKWSPDGKYLSFISTRQGSDEGKLFLLDRRGGEAQKILDITGKLLDYAWSPDGKKIALVLKELNPDDTVKTKTRKPFVMDRYHFKQDIEGYLTNKNSHLYLYNLETKKIDTLTKGKFDDAAPAWSPDGSQIAFVSNRTAEPDKNENMDIWVISTSPGFPAPRKITTWKGGDTNPVWSPDGKYIAYLQSTSDENFTMYGHSILAVLPKEGGTPLLLSKNTDRPVRNPKWSKDSKSIAVLLSDDRKSYPVLFSVTGGAMKKLADGENSYSEIENRKAGEWVAVMSTPQLPAELYTLQDQHEKRITHIQDTLFSNISLARVEGFVSTSSDGTKVSGILYTPSNSPIGKTLPLILFIHGGPVDQDAYEFDLERQMLANGGFAVAAVNYRGSNGRGVDYCRSIFADWGNREVKDIIGAANFLVAKGIADSTRMGIAGWSYGGILTDYTIASDTRFKAASSGAGSALQLSMYGVDEYVNQYNNELGTPWEHLDKWLQLSYPFLKANTIKTPTLFMASQSDFNVPSSGAEQMYQALRTTGVPAELVIYPGQFHQITVPSYHIDRLQRWLGWFNKYLK